MLLRTRNLALLAGLALTLAACGGSEGGGDTNTPTDPPGDHALAGGYNGPAGATGGSSGNMGMTIRDDGTVSGGYRALIPGNPENFDFAGTVTEAGAYNVTWTRVGGGAGGNASGQMTGSPTQGIQFSITVGGLTYNASVHSVN